MISGTYNNATRERFLQAQRERERKVREHRYERAEVQEIGAPFCVVKRMTYDPATDTLDEAA